MNLIEFCKKVRQCCKEELSSFAEPDGSYCYDIRIRLLTNTVFVRIELDNCAISAGSFHFYLEEDLDVNVSEEKLTDTLLNETKQIKEGYIKVILPNKDCLADVIEILKRSKDIKGE